MEHLSRPKLNIESKNIFFLSITLVFGFGEKISQNVMCGGLNLLSFLTWLLSLFPLMLFFFIFCPVMNDFHA